MFYRLSRHSPLHNRLRRLFYAVLWRLPEGLKYAVGTWLRRYRLPYRLVRPGATVVQVGAPWDTLRAGRSRAVHFARLAGPRGRVVVFEPDPESAAALRAFAARRGLSNLTVVGKGAWSAAGELSFLRDPAHPAANLVERFFAAGRGDRDQFERTTIAVDTLDSMLPAAGVEEVDLLSITTNGSENDILEGMAAHRDRVRYVATIGELGQYPALARYGFETYGGDDRGTTFVNRTLAEGAAGRPFRNGNPASARSG